MKFQIRRRFNPLKKLWRKSCKAGLIKSIPNLKVQMATARLVMFAENPSTPNTDNATNAIRNIKAQTDMHACKAMS
jgi:hypothetical protein